MKQMRVQGILTIALAVVITFLGIGDAGLFLGILGFALLKA